eukprot:209519_1
MYKFFQTKYDLLYCIQQLFDLIDINSDKYITWSEFTSYLVNAAMSRISKPTRKKLPRYGTSNTTDTTQHNNIVIKVKYLSLIDSIIAFEKHSRVLINYSKDLKLKKIIRGHRG